MDMIAGADIAILAHEVTFRIKATDDKAKNEKDPKFLLTSDKKVLWLP